MLAEKIRAICDRAFIMMRRRRAGDGNAAGVAAGNPANPAKQR
jgi:hypothetical protein